jgi:hypothetical protein
MLRYVQSQDSYTADFPDKVLICCDIASCNTKNGYLALLIRSSEWYEVGVER